jgi:hypothetical protein
MACRRRAAQLPAREVREIRADGEMVDAAKVELIAPEGEVIVAEELRDRRDTR